MILSMVLALDAPSLAGPFWQAQSEDGRRLSEDVLDALGAGSDDSSVSMGQRFRELDQIVARSASGQGEAVSASAVEHAKRFLALLPRNYSLPEVLADTDGDILIEWRPARDYIVTVSIAGNGQVHFAGLLQGRSIYGTERSLSDSIPEPIAMCLKSVNATAPAARR